LGYGRTRFLKRGWDQVNSLVFVTSNHKDCLNVAIQNHLCLELQIHIY